METHSNYPELLNSEFFEKSSVDPNLFASKILSLLPEDRFRFLGEDFESGRNGLLFVDEKTSLVFAFCPGGEFFCGINSIAKSALSRLMLLPEMRRNSVFADPEDLQTFLAFAGWRLENLQPFLIAIRPLGRNSLRRNFEVSNEDVPSAFEFESGDPPANLTYSEANRFCDAHSFRLPSEVEWEGAAKAWQHDLFVSDFHRLMEYPEVYLAPSDLDTHGQLANRIGLRGLGMCWEWTGDEFDSNRFYHCPTFEDFNGLRSVRGGGAATHFPWQHSDEWVVGSLISRTGFSMEERATLRPIFPLIPQH